MNRRSREQRFIADAVTATIAAQLHDHTDITEAQAHTAARHAVRALQNDGWCMHAPAPAHCPTGHRRCCDRPTATPDPSTSRRKAS